MDGGREDAVIGSAEVRKEGGRCGEPVRVGRESPRRSVKGDGRVDADVEFSAGVERHAGSHGFGGGKFIAEFSMNLSGVGASGCVFRLKSVEFLEDLDGDPDVIVLEVEHGEWVVNEDIRIEDKVFDSGGSSHGMGRICSRRTGERDRNLLVFWCGVGGRV